jgi:subtilisin family serine protease
MVVDADHASLVLSLLPEGVAADVSDSIPALGLSLVTVPRVEDAIQKLLELDNPPDQSVGPDLMDQLIAILRSRAASRWDGWYPTVGKNRIVMGPEAEPYTSPRDDPELGPKPGPRRLDLAPDTRPDDGVGVVVGVLDTAAIRSPFYADSVSFIGNSETSSKQVTKAFQAHGTFVTGLVHRHAPAARVVVYEALSRDKAVATAWESAKGMVHLLQAGANVINMSVGCTTWDNQPPFAMRAAVDRLRDRAVLVAAAGNYERKATSTPPSWPAALDGVLAVGSADDSGEASFFSPKQPWVDLVAKGSNVSSTFAANQRVSYTLGETTFAERFFGTAIWSGTSFAAAAVAGRIATLASRSGYPYTGSTPGTIAKQLRDQSWPQDTIAWRFIIPSSIASPARTSATGVAANP